MNVLQQTMLAFTASSLLALSAHAGASSNSSKIVVGGTEHQSNNPKGHEGSQPGSPGIGVYASKTPFKKTSIERLKKMASWGMGGSYDRGNHITYINEDHWLMKLSGHGDFGHYAFRDFKAGGADVYFGEWSDEGNMTDSTHTVYYVGKDKTNNMPTAGKVTYNVKGINNVENKGFLTGELKANFAKDSLSGDLSRNDLTIGIDATINSGTASFEGSATASGSSVAGTLAGDSKGSFFGANAEGLAGIATFTGNPQYDTAFGGTQ